MARLSVHDRQELLQSFILPEASDAANPFEQVIKAGHGVRDGKDFLQHFTLWADDKAVMLVLGDVDSRVDHNDTPS